MPSAFDAHTSANGDAVTTLSWSHTVGAGSPYLAVFAGALGGGPTQTVTYNSVGLTSRGGAEHSAGTFKAQMFDLVNPATGTNTILVTYDSARNASAAALSATGVNQVTPRTDSKAVDSGAGGSTTPAFTALTSSSSEVDFSAVISNTGSGPTDTTDAGWTMDEGASGTTGLHNPGNDIHIWAGHRTGAASVDRSDTLSSSGTWWMFGVSLAAAGGGTPIFLPARIIFRGNQGRYRTSKQRRPV